MKLLIAISYVTLLLSCNPCDKFKNEIYKEETVENMLDSTEVIELNSFIKSFEEPAFDQLDHEAYRLIYTYSLSDTAHLIQISKNLSKYYLIHKKLVSHDHLTKVLTVAMEKELSVEEWEKFVAAIYQNGYWMLPKKVPEKPVLDGSLSIIEGRRPAAKACGKRNYHIVVRGYPEEETFENLSARFWQSAE